MADDKPVTPPANQPPAGPRPHPAPVRPANAGQARPTNAGLARPGVTPANSAAAIPAIMRGPIAPPPTTERIAAPGATFADSRGSAKSPGPRGEAPAIEAREAAASGPTPPRPTPPQGTAGGDPTRAQPTPWQGTATGEPTPPQPTPFPGTPDGGPTRAQSPPLRGTADDPTPSQPTTPQTAAQTAASNRPTTAQPTPPRGHVPTAQGTAAVPKPPSLGLQFRPVVHVADLAASVVFFELLGAEVIHGGPDSDYVLMQLGTVQIGLLLRPADTRQGAVELNFVAAVPLDELEQRLRSRGVTIAEPAHSIDFGSQLHVRTPDGLVVKIDQLELDE